MNDCTVVGCGKTYHGLGYCKNHYRKFKIYGDPEGKHVFVPKECSKDGCDKIISEKGLCRKHSQRLRRTGTTDLKQRVSGCKIASCKNKHHAKGLCNMHYRMINRNMIVDSHSTNIINSHKGVCDICGTPNPGKNRNNFSIDHDHNTGIVRGLLCHACNVGLGHFSDNIELLQKAIKYLALSSNML
jgi:hypothetical protein